MFSFGKYSFTRLGASILMALSATGAIFAQGPKSGGEHKLRLCWQASLGGGAGDELAADTGAAYISFQESGIKAFDIKTGRELWSTELGGELASNLATDGETLFAVSSSTGAEIGAASILRGLSTRTGVTTWSVKLPEGRRFWLGREGEDLIAVSDTGMIAAIPVDLHTFRWAVKAGGLNAQPVISNGMILVDPAGGRTRLMSATDGRELSEFVSDHEPTAVAFLYGRAIGVGDDRGNISLYEEGENDPKWTHKSGARIASIQPTKHGVLVASYDNFIYMLGENGDVTWKRRLPSRPSLQPSVLGDLALATAGSTPEIFLVSLKSGKLVDQLDIPGGVISLSSGPFGALIASPTGALTLLSLDNCSR